MKNPADRNDEICGILRYAAHDERLVSSRNVKKEIVKAFDKKRAFVFFADSHLLNSLSAGSAEDSLREYISSIRNKMFEETAAGDGTLLSRLVSDTRLADRINTALMILHKALSKGSFTTLQNRRFVLIREIPGKPTLLHVSRETTVLTHTGQGPYWHEIPTLYLGLKTFDAIENSLRHGSEELFNCFVRVLAEEERAIENGFVHIHDGSEIVADIQYLIDAVIEYSSQRRPVSEVEALDSVTFSVKMRERFLELLDARTKENEMNFDYARNLSAIEEICRYGRKFKKNGDRKSLHEIVRLLVSASGHDLHEIRNRANAALERIISPKEYDAPLADTFISSHAGETVDFEFVLPDKRDGYFLRLYEYASSGEFSVDGETRFSDLPLTYDENSGSYRTSVCCDEFGTRDFCVVFRSNDSFEWIEGEGVNGRLSVLPELAGEIILEIFVDIHGHTGVYWNDGSGHPGLVYNENGEVIRLGRISDVEAHLDYLKTRYGITAIYLLGVLRRGSNRQDWALGATSPSPFSPDSLSEIEPRIGGAEELKRLVKKAHKNGIKILVDCIPHLNRLSDELDDENIVFCYNDEGVLIPRASTDGRYGTWDDGKLLNFRRLEVWQFIISSVERLIEEFDIDGIRMDSAHALPIMMKKNNYPLEYGKRRSSEEMVEGRIIINDRVDGHFQTTGYYDSQCREMIAVPFHQYAMFRFEKAARKKKKDFFINVAECYWGHEKYLTRSGIIPYNSALFKVCEKIMSGHSDVSEIYHLYNDYFPSIMSRGAEMLGILGNHDERRALNTFGTRGLRAAVGLTSFLSNTIMDYEGSAEGESWKVYPDNIFVNWNQFDSASDRSVDRFYSDIYFMHRRMKGRGHLLLSNNNMVAAALRMSSDDAGLWLGAFNFAPTNQTASIQFDAPDLPLNDDAFYRVVDPLYSPITGHYNYYTGKELRVARINTVVPYNKRMKILYLEKIDDVSSLYDEFLKDSFFRLCSISKSGNFFSNFAFNEIQATACDHEKLIEFISTKLIPLLYPESKHYLELGLKRALFHVYRTDVCGSESVYDLFRLMISSSERRISDLGKALMNHNSKGRWVFLSAEADPFSKSGGLANVVFELPRELVKQGEDVYVITPYYRSGDSKAMAKMKAAHERYGIKYSGVNVKFKILDNEYEVGVHQSDVDGVKYLLLDHHELFNGLYWGVNGEEKLVRRVGFARACAEVVCAFDLNPYFLFTNDAFCAPFNGIVRSDNFYSNHPSFSRTSFFHIVHNGGWQYFDSYARYENGFDLFRLFNLPDWKFADFSDPIDGSKLNLMASGVRFADRVVTVSPSYAKQIEYHCDGLEQILHNVKGISNAIGYDLRERMMIKFNSVNFAKRNYPRLMAYLKTDDELNEKVSARYPEILSGIDAVVAIADSKRNYIVTRAMNKMMLQIERGLEVDPDKVIFVMIHRITEQKGFSLLLSASEGIFKTLGFQAIIGGAVSGGDEKGEEIAHSLWVMGQYYSRNANVSIGFQELSVPLFSADIFLMPSMNEPGGISQLEAFLCGNLVLARATGGLRDTVFPVRHSDGHVEGNGFLFTDYNPTAFYNAMERAMTFFRTADEETIYQARMNAERSVYFWKRPAQEYIEMVYDQKEIIRKDNSSK